MTSMISSKRPRGFTLIELLVAIVIVAILAVVAFSIAGKARTRANSMQCLQNLRDWSVVFNSAAQDRNGRLPTPLNWAAISNTPYDPTKPNPGRAPFVDYWDTDITVAFSIQLQKRACPCLDEGLSPTGNRAPTYMMNWRLSEKPSYLECNLGRVKRASKKILFIDGNVGCTLRLNNKSDISRWIGPAAEEHGGKVNAVFADLHVEPIAPAELEANWNTYVLPQS
ncbi:MAG: hypothetical protein RLZ97_1756 [Verrucomicrobiota bacterium]|jgi:prepilin-type N-terminal cleavage/methylation domain-containing protein/prepilin-type processing-associated H-X9-DG protein